MVQAGLKGPPHPPVHRLLWSKAWKSALELTEFWLELVPKRLPFATFMLNNCHFAHFTCHFCSAEINICPSLDWDPETADVHHLFLCWHTRPSSKGLGRPRNSAGPSSRWESEHACAQQSQRTRTIFSLLLRRLHPRQWLHRSVCSWGQMEIPLGSTASSVFPHFSGEKPHSAQEQCKSPSVDASKSTECLTSSKILHKQSP